MGRFFITPREINFINDIAKEIVKDVIGQKIYYFPISEIKSKVHDVYEESPDKVFENPIEIDCFFEIIKGPASDVIFGQIEHKTYITITGKQSRKGQFISKIFGPTSEEYTDSGAVQETFVQQRGAETNSEGTTGDVRDLQKNGVLDTPITGPKEVSAKGDPQNVGSAFYDED